jgi:hypothetical protein
MGTPYIEHIPIRFIRLTKRGDRILLSVKTEDKKWKIIVDERWAHLRECGVYPKGIQLAPEVDRKETRYIDDKQNPI